MLEYRVDPKCERMKTFQRQAKQTRLSRVSAAVLVVIAAVPQPSHAIVSSLGGTGIFNGVSINDAIGADVFYNQGFGGQGAIVANIEAGAIWTGHESLNGRIAQTIYDPSITGTQLGQADWHATMVGQAIGGSGPYLHQLGIAPLATMWAGAIATSWSAAPFVQYSTSFSITDNSFLYAYRTATQTGISGLNADVINSSWGFGDSAGSSELTIAIDALLSAHQVVGVFSAGNSGPGADSVGGPGTGYNGITVAALTNSAQNLAYDTVADFSSRAPSAAYNPQTGIITPGMRATVDIAAPGDNLTLAFYGGRTGGHVAGTDPTGGLGSYYIGDVSGTSFSAPIVAGAAALLVDAGKAFGIAEMTHPLVIKSVLMAGATPTIGWDNGQFLDESVTRTLQALDYTSGAGALDLRNSHDIYLGSSQLLAPSVYSTDGLTTLGIAGGGGSAEVASSGWDLGTIQAGANIYTLAQTLAAGSEMSAVLTWYAQRGLGVDLTSAEDVALSNLSLEIWRLDAVDGNHLVGRSESPFGTVEHLRMNLADAGNYQFRVVWDGQNYNTAALPVLATDYGLAWSINSIPEPQTLLLLWLVSFIMVRRHRAIS